jgi:hypothetical protein
VVNHERDRTVETLQVLAREAERVEGTVQARSRWSADLRRQASGARAGGLECARMQDDRPPVTLHELLREARRRLHTCSRLEPTQQPCVPRAELLEPGKLGGRRPRSIRYAGPEKVTRGMLTRPHKHNGEREHNRAAGQAKEKAQRKPPRDHADTTPRAGA